MSKEGKCLIFRKDNSGQKVWSKRYFKIRDDLLLYARNASDKQWSKITLSGAFCEADERRAEKFQWVIRDTPRGNFYLRAMDEDDMYDWIEQCNVAAGADEGGEEDYGDEEYGDEDLGDEEYGDGDEDYDEEYDDEY